MDLKTKESGLHIGQKTDPTKGQEKEQKKPKKSQKAILQRLNDWLIDQSGVKTKHKVTFFRLLATMINAGVSLVKSLRILEEQSEDPKLKKVIGLIALGVEKGQTLSSGMEEFPEVFAESHVGMIKSGEVSGRLNSVLIQIADQTEKNAKIAGKIKGAMMYPLAIVIVLFIVVVAVVVLVIPKMRDIFGQAGADLPLATRILISLSDFLTSSFLGLPNWLNLIVFIGVMVVLFNLWRRTDSGRLRWHQFVLKLPVFGKLNQKVVLAKFCNSLSTLTKSGISIVKTLRITAQTVGNEVYKRRIELTAKDVEQGLTIAENIRDDKKIFPEMLVSMVSVGEQTAQLDKVTSKVADFYDDEVDNIVKNLAALMEPIIILLIGIVVGFLVAAIMLPIMKMSEVVAA